MRPRNFLRCAAVLAAAGLLAGLSSSTFASAIVEVNGGGTVAYSLEVGQTIDIPIFAKVSDSAAPAIPASGIFTYDFDALVGNSGGLQIVSITARGNLALGNPGFTTINSAGAHNINAGFDINGIGSTLPAELFTLTVKGLAPGNNSINISNSIIPQGTPILLYNNTEPQVNSSPISVQVLPISAIPEPASIALLTAGASLLLRRRRTY